jgi:hypothetical protein
MGMKGVLSWEGTVTEKGFISFAARKSAGRRTGLTAAKVMKPCSELNRRRMKKVSSVSRRANQREEGRG